MNFVQNTERGCLECKGCCETSGSKLSVHDWLCDIPEEEHATAYVEVQFKNTRKEYFLNEDHIPLEKGDIVAVEASPAQHNQQKDLSHRPPLRFRALGRSQGART